MTASRFARRAACSTVLVLAAAWPAAARASACALTEYRDPGPPVQDWLVPDDPLAMPIYPADGSVVRQNPPILRWPMAGAQASYEVRLTGPDGLARQRITRRNWLFLPATLVPGRYAWEVRVWGSRSEPSPWSAPRRFTVPENAHAFVLPDSEAIFEKVSRTKRPRSLPRGKDRAELLAALKSGSRSQDFGIYLTKLRRRLARTLPDEPPMAARPGEGFFDRLSRDLFGKSDRRSARIARWRAAQVIKHATYPELDAARFGAYAWAVTGDKDFLRGAKRRALHLARWDPRGSTGVPSDDHVAREMAFGLAVLYDVLHGELDEAERATIRQAVLARTQDLFDMFIVNPRRALERHPLNSHGIRHAGGISAIAVLMAGDTERARLWFFGTFPLYVAINNPWGGDDGGFANGTNYAGWNLLNYLDQWDVINRATGIDLARMAWSREVGRYLAYFLPPATPSGAFGDGAEYRRPKVWSRLAALYAQRAPSPAAERYAALWNRSAPEDPDPKLLFGPMPAEVAAADDCGDLPDAAVFPEIGWAAMHSSLADPDRTSVYFKSSPYGSFNHSHADQNGFVINAGGRRLAIDSGHYDAYRSAHHEKWTMRTVAHNAITFDGGKGQATRSKSAGGRIVAFGHSRRLDYVVGDATVAYRGALSKAIRTLAFLRPDVVLVYDRVVAPEPRRWEWNIHAMEEFAEDAQGGIRVASGPVSLCVQVLEGPPVEFTKTNRFPEKPDEFFGKKPDQWHGRFTAREPRTEAEFLVLLAVNCRGVGVAATSRRGGGFDVVIDGVRTSIGEFGAEVERD